MSLLKASTPRAYSQSIMIDYHCCAQSQLLLAEFFCGRIPRSVFLMLTMTAPALLKSYLECGSRCHRATENKEAVQGFEGLDAFSRVKIAVSRKVNNRSNRICNHDNHDYDHNNHNHNFNYYIFYLDDNNNDCNFHLLATGAVR